MSDETMQLMTACRCAQFCMLRMSMCVTLVIVHSGLKGVQGVLVVIHFYVAICS